jgi:hypothetical protein
MAWEETMESEWSRGPGADEEVIEQADASNIEGGVAEATANGKRPSFEA